MIFFHGIKHLGLADFDPDLVLWLHLHSHALRLQRFALVLIAKAMIRLVNACAHAPQVLLLLHLPHVQVGR